MVKYPRLSTSQGKGIMKNDTANQEGYTADTQEHDTLSSTSGHLGVRVGRGSGMPPVSTSVGSRSRHEQERAEAVGGEPQKPERADNTSEEKIAPKVAKAESLTDKQALQLVKDDFRLLQKKLIYVIDNANIPGSVHKELETAKIYCQLPISTELPEDINSDDFKDSIRALASLAHYSKIVIDNSLFPGEMAEEVYTAVIMCRHILDRWVKDA
jgi:hypothetical protein